MFPKVKLVFYWLEISTWHELSITFTMALNSKYAIWNSMPFNFCLSIFADVEPIVHKSAAPPLHRRFAQLISNLKTLFKGKMLHSGE